MPPYEYGVEYFYGDDSSIQMRRTLHMDEDKARRAVALQVVAGAVLMRRPTRLGGMWEAVLDD